jgi:hypothetical protein
VFLFVHFGRPELVDAHHFSALRFFDYLATLFPTRDGSGRMGKKGCKDLEQLVRRVSSWGSIDPSTSLNSMKFESRPQVVVIMLQGRPILGVGKAAYVESTAKHSLCTWTRMFSKFCSRKRNGEYQYGGLKVIDDRWVVLKSATDPSSLPLDGGRQVLSLATNEREVLVDGQETNRTKFTSNVATDVIPIKIVDQDYIYSVAFLADGKHVVSGGREKKIRQKLH